MTKITFLAHGTTTDNETNKATGWLPGELSELGIKQSKQLGKQVGDVQFDVVDCTLQIRAKDNIKLNS